VEDCIEANIVPAITFPSLIEKYDVEGYGLLQIDTEGFDYEVIKAAGIDRYRPALINYEHAHLSSADQRECGRYLSRLGYHMFAHDGNTAAYLLDTD
jgi:hypothetical protein